MSLGDTPATLGLDATDLSACFTPRLTVLRTSIGSTVLYFEAVIIAESDGPVAAFVPAAAAAPGAEVSLLAAQDDGTGEHAELVHGSYVELDALDKAFAIGPDHDVATKASEIFVGVWSTAH